MSSQCAGTMRKYAGARRLTRQLMDITAHLPWRQKPVLLLHTSLDPLHADGSVGRTDRAGAGKHPSAVELGATPLTEPS
jgi:hypothetical protein